MAEFLSMEPQEKPSQAPKLTQDSVLRERLITRVAEWQSCVASADSEQGLSGQTNQNPAARSRVNLAEDLDDVLHACVTRIKEDGGEWIAPPARPGREMKPRRGDAIAASRPRSDDPFTTQRRIRTRSRWMDVTVLFVMSALVLAICVYVFCWPD